MNGKYLDEYYGKQMARFGTEEFTLYGSRASQIERFMLVPKYASTKMNGSFLDIGAGVCELYDWLKENKLPMPEKYVATEPLEVVYDKAKIAHPELDIRLIDVVEEDSKDIGTFDVIAALGVCAVKLGSYSYTDRYWQDFIEKGYELLNDQGVFIWNAFSPKKSEIRSEDYILDPMDAFKFAMRITDRVIIDHSYMPHDFALIMFKGDNRWRKEWKQKGGWTHV